MSQLQVCLSAEGVKNVSWPWLSPFRVWDSLTIAFTGKCVYMADHFILLRLNHFGLRVDREGWWFEHSTSQLPVCLSAGVLKTFPDPGYFRSEHGVYIYIYIYIYSIRFNVALVHICRTPLKEHLASPANQVNWVVFYTVFTINKSIRVLDILR